MPTPRSIAAIWRKKLESRIKITTNHVVDGSLGIFGQLELDECEAAVLLGLVVDGQLHLRDVAERDEGGSDHAFVHFLSKSSYKKSLEDHLGTQQLSSYHLDISALLPWKQKPKEVVTIKLI